MSIAIRLATTADTAAICSTDSRVPSDPARRPFIERAVAAAECYVAAEDDTIRAYVVFDRSFFEQPFVSLLNVDAEQRRRGIGAALMRHVESICTEEKLFTSTNESNVPMQRLCEQLGFAKSGRMENLDEGDPEIVYFKRLRARADS